MAIVTIKETGFDPGIITSDARAFSGPTVINSVVLDEYYLINSVTGQPQFATWLYVGTAGNVNFTKWDNTNITINNLAAGVWHRMGTIKINTSGTTATDILWGS